MSLDRVRGGVPVISILAACALVACNDTSAPVEARRSAPIARAVANLPVANATIRQLPGLVGTFDPIAINDSDLVVGITVDVTGETKPWRWDPKTGLHYLINASGMVPEAVNDNGTIVGSGGPVAVAWWGDNNMRKFQNPPNYPGECYATGINASGHIVGICGITGEPRHGAIFNWHGPATLSSGPGIFNAISNDGYIAGGGDIQSTFLSAFIQTPAGWRSILPQADGQPTGFASAVAITYHGWAAGSDGEASGCNEAVAWLAAPHQYRPEYRMGTCGVATGITDDWYVTGTGSAGTGTRSDSATVRAFVWFPGKGTQRLPTLLSPDVSTAVAINARHHILGTIVSGGVQHTVIWDVAPRN